MRWLIALTASGCIGGTSFVCVTDGDCAPGTCEASGACSFQDGDCDSGRRYGDFGGELSGECVALTLAAPDATPPPPPTPDAAPVVPAPYGGDDFEGAALDPRWEIFGAAGLDVSVSGGQLVLVPSVRQVWYQAQRGGFVHQTITGDVRVTARVSVRSQAMPGVPPVNDVHLAGVMARDGTTLAENYVFIGVGRLGGLAVETKNTIDSTTTLDSPAWPSGEAELRLCRLGPTFHLYKRPFAGGPWELAASLTRDDLPAALQIGLFVSADTAPPDLRATIEETRLATPTSLADCAGE